MSEQPRPRLACGLVVVEGVVAEVECELSRFGEGAGCRAADWLGGHDLGAERGVSAEDTEIPQ